MKQRGQPGQRMTEGGDGAAHAPHEQPAAVRDGPPVAKTFQASHTLATVETRTSEFTQMGFLTWRCDECDIWRVPGAPFCLSGEKQLFLKTCSLNDTSRLCCNCERQREQYYWQDRCIQLYRRGERSETAHVPLLAPPDRLVDLASQEVIWSCAEGEKPMDRFKEIMKESTAVDEGSSRTAWYSDLSCNMCRRRVGLKTHDLMAKEKAIAYHELNAATLAAKSKKKKKK